ncbi:MAG: hypothetical protein MJ061_01990 [Mailhella sp.]|nr:hypothetical protein [Mailhella sp.]
MADSRLAGSYAAENIIAAAAAAHLLGLSPEEIAEGIANAPTPDQRFAYCEAGGWTVIDDTYNANPLSMRRMMEAARDRIGDGTLVFVLGEMLELGDEAVQSHREIGRLAAELGCSGLLWYGGHADDVRNGFEEAGAKGSFHRLENHQDFIPELKKLLSAIPEKSTKAVLFKGSRGNRLEKLVKLFMEAV